MLQKLGQQIFVTNLEKKWGSLDSERVKEVIYSSLVEQKTELFLFVEEWIVFLKQKLITSQFLRILPKSRTDCVTWNINTEGSVYLELKLTIVT